MKIEFTFQAGVNQPERLAWCDKTSAVTPNRCSPCVQMETKGACNQLKPCQVQRNEAPAWSTRIRGAHGLLEAQCTSINEVEQIRLDLTNGALAKLESKSSPETGLYARVPVVFQTRASSLWLSEGLNLAQRLLGGLRFSAASSHERKVLFWFGSHLAEESEPGYTWAYLLVLSSSPPVSCRQRLINIKRYLEEFLHRHKSMWCSHYYALHFTLSAKMCM